jgi:hypothetical protein
MKKYLDADWGSRRQCLWHDGLCVTQDGPERVGDAAGKMAFLNVSQITLVVS